MHSHKTTCIFKADEQGRKVIAKILSGASDKNTTLDEAIYVLTRAGFARDGGKGSHQVFRHPDGRKMVIPAHGKDIKPVYVRQIRNLLQP